ncbi:MAG: zf-TFIIB domain-containing protein [Planctomycetes bacterium]|nr:zf-TFIIB domain-containing protein [Planctomycetota bacterium]
MTNLRCPGCEAPLVVFELEGVEVDRCLECGGTWLDAGELERLVELSGADSGGWSRALGRAAGEAHGARRCLRCGRKLRRAPVHDVEIDRCPLGHGLWFDRGEVEALVRAGPAGGEGAVARFFGELFRKDLGESGRRET